MDQIFAWLIKLLFFVMLAPFFICLIVQLTVGLVAAVLPIVLIGSVIAGVTCGITAALILRRRLPLPGRSNPYPGAPPLGPHRVRRSRSSEWR
jgi:hypothetical protein